MSAFRAASLDRVTAIITTAVGLLLIAVAASYFLRPATDNNRWLAALLPSLSIMLFVISVLLKARSYNITSHNLEVKQMVGTTIKIPLDQIISVQSTTQRGAIRTFGIGGFFGYVGRFNGNERWFVTNRNKMVKIETTKSVYVVSPADRESFIQQLKQKASLK